MITPATSPGYLAAVNNAPSAEAAQSTVQNNSGTGERVSISETGQTASAIRRKLSPGGVITVESIQDQFNTDTGAVEKKLQGLYKQLGIDHETEMNISVGYDGKILVHGEGAKAKELEEAINADQELSNTIRRASANAALLEAVKKHEEFPQAYDLDPEEAVERYGYLLEDGHNYHVNFSFSNNELGTSVSYV